MCWRLPPQVLEAATPCTRGCHATHRRYDPMAMRAKHGRMQGVPLEPLLLLSQARLHPLS